VVADIAIGMRVRLVAGAKTTRESLPLGVFGRPYGIPSPLGEISTHSLVPFGCKERARVAELLSYVGERAVHYVLLLLFSFGFLQQNIAADKSLF
jgi:hypothetical protein